MGLGCRAANRCSKSGGSKGKGERQDEQLHLSVDVKSAEKHLMKFLSVEGVTGQEAAIAAAVSDELKKVGVPTSAIRFDDANTRIPLPTQIGNLIVDLPGTLPGPRFLFATHLDTVPLCAGVPNQPSRCASTRACWNSVADYGLERCCFSRVISSGDQSRTSVTSIHASM